MTNVVNRSSKDFFDALGEGSWRIRCVPSLISQSENQTVIGALRPGITRRLGAGVHGSENIADECPYRMTTPGRDSKDPGWLQGDND